MAGYDWASLGKKLSEKADGFDKQVLDRVVNILQGAQIDGVSLDPIAKASSSVKDGLNAIVQQIIEWVIDQLNGLKFPPIVVSMSVVWVKDPDGVVDKVPQTTVCYFTTDGDGKNSRCPSRLERPPIMALADIIDGLPLKEGKKQTARYRNTGSLRVQREQSMFLSRWSRTAAFLWPV